MFFSFEGRQIRPLIAGIFVTMATVLGGSTTAQAQATPTPTLSTQFNPTTIGPGGGSTLTFTIDNSAGGVVTGLAFSDTLPTTPGPVTITTPSNASTNCPGPGGSGFASLTAPDGGNTISLSGGSLVAGGNCTVSVNVTASTPGMYTNPAVTLNSSVGSTMSLPHDLTVVTTLPGFTKSFAPPSVPLGGSSTLTYTIDNSANASRVGSLGFTENLPIGLQVASPANASTDCVSASFPNTTITAVPGSSTIVLDAIGFNGSPGFEVLQAGATCTVSVDVTATGVGMLTATSGPLLADFVSAGTSTDTLDVTVTPLNITKTFLTNPVNAGGTTTLRFTIENFDRAFSATGVNFTDNLGPALPGLTFTSLATNNCGGAVTGVGSGNIALTGGVIAVGSTCTIDALLSVPAGAAGDRYTNTTSVVSGMVNGNPVTGNAATADLIIPLGGGAPAVTLNVLTPAPVAGAPITVQFTIDNGSTTQGAHQLARVSEPNSAAAFYQYASKLKN